MPEAVVFLRQEKKFVRPLIEASDAGSRFVQCRIFPIGRSQKHRFDARLALQSLEQFVGDLLRTTTHQLGMVETDDEDFDVALRFGHFFRLKKCSQRALMGAAEWRKLAAQDRECSSSRFRPRP
jgi:hypothetical protein